MTRRLVLFLAIAAVAIALAARWAAGPEVAAVAARGDLVQTVVSTGRVSSRSRIDIDSVLLGTVAAVEVREGALVAFAGSVGGGALAAVLAARRAARLDPVQAIRSA